MVSRLKLSSRIENETGFSIMMNDGIKSKIEPAGIPEGTIVEVYHLFRNQPARLSFQRRPSTESTKIVDVVVQHAIAHPKCRFRLDSEEREILNAPITENISDRLYNLLGAQAQRLLPLENPIEDEDVPGDERWSGWISPPEVTRGRGDDVHVLINGRPVASQSFLQAIRRGYRTRLMVGRHPVAVIQLELAPEELDVNVHPTKREVRLRNSWRVLERLERAISYTLSKTPTIPDSGGEISGIQGLESQFKSRNVAEKTQLIPDIDQQTRDAPAWARSAVAQLTLQGEVTENKPSIDVKPRPISYSPNAQNILPGMEKEPISPALSEAERKLHRHSGKGERSSPIDEPTPSEKIVNDLPPMEPLSQFADSYIIAQAKDELLMIDQHALHERIRYERLRDNQAGWEPQERIAPLILQLDTSQSERLKENQEILEPLGFKFENDKQGWSVISAPSIIPGGNIEGFVIDLLQDLANEDGPLETVERRRDYVAFLQACRGAVKANEQLTIAEMRRLLDDMRRVPNPWACVHGRPTALRIPVNQLDLHFGRQG